MDRRRNRKHSNNWNNQKRSEQSRENKQKMLRHAKLSVLNAGSRLQILQVLLQTSLPENLSILTVY